MEILAFIPRSELYSLILVCKKWRKFIENAGEMLPQLQVINIRFHDDIDQRGISGNENFFMEFSNNIKKGICLSKEEVKNRQIMKHGIMEYYLCVQTPENIVDRFQEVAKLIGLEKFLIKDFFINDVVVHQGNIINGIISRFRENFPGTYFFKLMYIEQNLDCISASIINFGATDSVNMSQMENPNLFNFGPNYEIGIAEFSDFNNEVNIDHFKKFISDIGVESKKRRHLVLNISQSQTFKPILSAIIDIFNKAINPKNLFETISILTSFNEEYLTIRRWVYEFLHDYQLKFMMLDQVYYKEHPKLEWRLQIDMEYLDNNEYAEEVELKIIKN